MHCNCWVGNVSRREQLVNSERRADHLQHLRVVAPQGPLASEVRHECRPVLQAAGVHPRDPVEQFGPAREIRPDSARVRGGRPGRAVASRGRRRDRCTRDASPARTAEYAAARVLAPSRMMCSEGPIRLPEVSLQRSCEPDYTLIVLPGHLHTKPRDFHMSRPTLYSPRCRAWMALVACPLLLAE